MSIPTPPAAPPSPAVPGPPAVPSSPAVPVPVAPPGPAARRPPGWAPPVVVAAVVGAMALSTAPTALFPLYADRDGLTPSTTTAVFAVFAVGVVAGLLLAGASSDRWGRQRVLVGATALEAVAAVVLALAPGTPGLVAGRVVCGLGVGVLAVTGAVTVRELTAHRGPVARRRWGVAAGSMSMAGLGLGPLLSGLVAGTAPAPLHLPYAVAAVLLTALALALTRLPSRAGPRAPAPSRGAGASRAPAGAAVLAFTAFAGTGFFGALLPEALGATGVDLPTAANGAAIAAVFLAGALAPAVVPAGDLRGLRSGAAALGAGAVGVAVALLAGAPLLLLLAGPVVGAGSGLLFAGAVGAASQLPPAERTAATRTVFLAAYAGLALPTTGLGALLVVVPLPPASTAYVLLLLVLLALGVRRRGAQAARG